MQGLYAIVDLPHPHGLRPLELTRAVLGDRLDGGRDGAAVVQLRAKRASTEQRVAWLAQMVPLCRAAGAMLVVNDDLEAALASEADALHLGQDDPFAHELEAVRRRAAAVGRDALRVGLSTHELAQVRAAGRQAPDYLALGPVAPTRSKQDPEPTVGMTGLLDGCRVAACPLVAIGGLDGTSGSHAIEYGASAVAVIGALVHETLPRIRDEAISLARRFREAAAPLSLDEVHRRIPVLPLEQLAELARWGDALSLNLGLGLPARFSPRVVDGRAQYRPSDVIDLVEALGKLPTESWDDWRGRGLEDEGPLVQLRGRTLH
ncbi:MAG: thiamine phosphate synthase [Nannocystaceae bacterium]